MQRQPLYQVFKVDILPLGRTLIAHYSETGSDTLLTHRVGAVPFEHYLKCMADVDCPTLAEWIVRSTKQELNDRIAAYMECMKWEREEAEMCTSLEYREHIGVL